MTPFLTVVICTHNPRRDYLQETLDSIRAQTLSQDQWEFLLIDNRSDTPLAEELDLSWHPQARVVREDKLGLTHARLRSFAEARGEAILYSDDDTVLEPHYLERAVDLVRRLPTLGAFGGVNIPRYEVPPPAWFPEFLGSMACRDLGPEPMVASWEGVPVEQRQYPSCAPVGAGLVLRKEAYAQYITAASNDPLRTGLGRSGANLASGEDNDIVMTLLANGWSVGYFPELRLEHLIPARRISAEYVEKLTYSSNKTWVLVLALHGIRPWKAVPRWAVPFLKWRAFLRNGAWRSERDRILWRGACGQFESRALLSKAPSATT